MSEQSESVFLVRIYRHYRRWYWKRVDERGDVVQPYVHEGPFETAYGAALNANAVKRAAAGEPT